MKKRRMKMPNKTWKVVLESEPYGREDFQEVASLNSAMATFNELVDSASREFRNDRIPREVSLVCLMGSRKNFDEESGWP